MTKAIKVIMMFIRTLECSHCHAHYNHEDMHTVCTICGNTLSVKYDLDVIKETVKKESFATRGNPLEIF